MKSIHNTTSMIAIFAAILSLSLGFAPQALAGTTTTGSTLELTLIADCGFSITDVDTQESADPSLVSSATFLIDMDNSGTGTIAVSANLGDSTQDTSVTLDPFIGGFADGTRQVTTDVHIQPSDVDFNADDGIGSVGTQAMANDGTDTLIANLGPTGPAGENGARTVTITADLTNLLNLPATGLQTADATFTGGLCS